MVSVNITPKVLRCSASFGFGVVVRIVKAAGHYVFAPLRGLALGGAKACLDLVAVFSDTPPPAAGW